MSNRHEAGCLPKIRTYAEFERAAFLVFGHDIEISYGVFLAGKAVVVLF